jgi:hypothetical protein
MKLIITGNFKYSIFIIVSLFATTCTGQVTFSCNYLNEPEPGNTPLIFGKGIVSVEGENTHACIFSPDGSILIFSRYPERKSYIMTFSKGQWTGPTEAFFEGKETSFSQDGNKLFYYKTDGDIYYSEKTGTGWKNSITAGTAINTSVTEYYPSNTNDGTLFFSRNGKWDEGRIMYATYTEGKYNTPIDMGLPVNAGGASHAYIAPDKSYMLFNSPRTGSHTQLDIWISYHNADNTWSEPVNPGTTINSGADAILCPKITPDGKYMFFTKLTFSNNTGNVYWVSTNFIDSMKTITNIRKSKTSDMNIYPNPNKGKFTVNFGVVPFNQYNIAFFDIQGKKIFNRSIQNIRNLFTDLACYSSGVYFVGIINEGKVFTSEVCIQ